MIINSNNQVDLNEESVIINDTEDKETDPSVKVLTTLDPIIDKRDYRIKRERIDDIPGIISVTPKKILAEDNSFSNKWSFHIEICWDNSEMVKSRKEAISIEAFNKIYEFIKRKNPFGDKFLPSYLNNYILLQGCNKTTGLINLGFEKNSNKINKCYRIISIDKQSKIWKILAPNGIILDWKRGQGGSLLKGTIKIEDNTTDILHFLLNNWKEINVEYGLIEDIEINEKMFSIMFKRGNTIIELPIYECYETLEQIVEKQEKMGSDICYDTITWISERPNGTTYYYDLRVDKLYKQAVNILKELDKDKI